MYFGSDQGEARRQKSKAARQRRTERLAEKKKEMLKATEDQIDFIHVMKNIINARKNSLLGVVLAQFCFDQMFTLTYLSYGIFQPDITL